MTFGLELELDSAGTQMEFVNWQIGISMISRLDTPKRQYEFETLVFLFGRPQYLIVGN